MYLLTILAYVIVFWHAEAPNKWRLVREDDVLWTLLVVLLQPALLGGVAYLGARRARGLLAAHGEGPPAAQHYHHRLMFWLRVAAIVGFAVSVFGTRWPVWFTFRVAALQIVGDVIVLTPYVAGVLAVWLAAYPVERDLRAGAMTVAAGSGRPSTQPWRLASYLDFNVRHHILIVAVPMTLILFAANVTRVYEEPLRDWSGRLWVPDALLGLWALGVFLVTPTMLTRVWRTASLEPGLTRTRLDELCHTIGIRARDILIWQSDGMTINAAVMGVFAPVRYVLLSDGLLATMDAQQIAAVFGHEAGHVRHRHIQHLLVFAYVGWLLAAALMEVAARAAFESASDGTSSAAAVQGIQALGVAVTALYWGFGFGWLSRRFERQADLFGAMCMAPEPSECARPCSVHPDAETALAESGRVCATGAARFASALDRVAMLNGIPPEERSWRHSSVGSRIRFLASVAGDPARGIRFERMIRRVKAAAFAAAVLGSVLWVYYWTIVPEPGIMRLEAGGLGS